MLRIYSELAYRDRDGNLARKFCRGEAVGRQFMKLNRDITVRLLRPALTDNLHTLSYLKSRRIIWIQASRSNYQGGQMRNFVIWSIYC
jgi:hypothetical protein